MPRKNCKHGKRENCPDCFPQDFCSHGRLRRMCGVCGVGRGKYTVHLRNATMRGIRNELTFERYTYLCRLDCTYCGTPEANGVDRVDSSGHYTIENSVPSCKHCNSIKGSLPVEEFLYHSRRIAAIHLIGEGDVDARTPENDRMAHSPEPEVHVALQ